MLISNGISDYRNIGQMFRIAEGFGVSRIYFDRDFAKSRSKVERISRSTVNSIGYRQYSNPLTLAAQLRNEGFSILALEKCDSSINLTNFDLDNNSSVALIMGNEQVGVSQDWLDEVDLSVHIPMFGINTSFNAIHALSIALYELRRPEMKE